MSPQLRAALRGLAIAAGVAVTLASLLAFRRADWPIYLAFVLLALVPIHTFHPFLAPAWSSKGKGLWPVIQDLELAFILALTPSVFLILYGYATNGIVGAVAWSLAALGLHVMLKRLTERRVAVEEQNRQLTALNH